MTTTATKRRKKASKKKAAKAQLTARTADKYVLYQQAVQAPEHEVAFFDRVYKSTFGKLPVVLREDFAGTFAVSCLWARKPDRQAIAVDNDPEPLDWGKAHNLTKIPAKAQQRVRILEQDVRTVTSPKADVLAAQNFSFWCFNTRAQLKEYFQYARRNMASQSIMVMDMMGGPECYEDDRTEERQFDGFEYVWEQAGFNPITNEGQWRIHFHFDDGTKLKKAFTYNWRFWSLPETREILDEVGFDETFVYWEGTDRKTGEGNDVWRRAEKADNDPAWIAYLVAVKR